MTQKLLILITAVVTILAAVFVFYSNLNPAAQTSAQSSSPEVVPDYIVYRHLFRQIAAFKARADELERQGVNPSPFRNFFKQKANLSDEEALKLEQTAMRYAQEVRAIDERARAVVQAYRAHYPKGQVPHGQQPLPPSPELRQLTRERNELVLRKRDELRAALGEQSFTRFQQFVKNRIAPNVRNIPEQ